MCLFYRLRIADKCRLLKAAHFHNLRTLRSSLSFLATSPILSHSSIKCQCLSSSSSATGTGTGSVANSVNDTDSSRAPATHNTGPVVTGLAHEVNKANLSSSHTASADIATADSDGKKDQQSDDDSKKEKKSKYWWTSPQYAHIVGMASLTIMFGPLGVYLAWSWGKLPGHTYSPYFIRVSDT
jgi:hypothetical protein